MPPLVQLIIYALPLRLTPLALDMLCGNTFCWEGEGADGIERCQGDWPPGEEAPVSAARSCRVLQPRLASFRRAVGERDEQRSVLSGN